MLELTEKRTLHSKTHDLGNGQHRLTASMIPMHYEENGKLLDIDMTIRDGVVNSGLYKIELMTDKIGFHAIDRASGKKISVSLNKLGNASPVYSSPRLEGCKAIWEAVNQGVDIEFIFNPHQVNIFRVLQNAQAEKFAEWSVEEELGEKTIKMNDKIRGRDAAKNETKHTVVIAPPSTANNRKSYVIRDTFDSKVFKRNPQTRVKEESADVSYPVRIDPTITITISDTTDDGYAYSGTTAGTRFNNAYNSNIVYSPMSFKYRSFSRFPGITIPQSSTINSAILKLYSLNSSTVDPIIKIEAKDVNNPSAPTNFAGVFTPGTIASNVKTYTVAAANNTFTSIDVQSIVQELVNSFDYSNEAMLFFQKIKTPASARYFTWEDFSSAGTNPAQLVIDYTAGGGSNIKTWNGLVDASTKTWNGLARASIKTFNGLS